MSSLVIREREQDDADIERYSKRPKIDDEFAPSAVDFASHILPPSHSLLGIPLPTAKEGQPLNFLEADVGISEYIGRGEAKVEGIIKQRFTDFLVFEVDQDSKVIHMKSLGKPDSPAKEKRDVSLALTTSTAVENPALVDAGETELYSVIKESAASESTSVTENTNSLPEPLGLNTSTKEEHWSEHFDATLAAFLDQDKVSELKKIFLEGPEPPRVSDAGWGTRVASTSTLEESIPLEDAKKSEDKGGRDNGRGRGGKRGGRGGRGGGRGGGREDTRNVISSPITSKDTRTAFHKAIRELFGGKLDTETGASGPPEEGSRILIKWAKRGGGRGGGRNGRADGSGIIARTPRGTYPPYIHFTLQKTNRDTQDALGHLSRNLHVNIKDLSVAGTKDKRGVTVQRVSLNRHNKSVEEVWKLANGLGPRRTLEDVMTQRGERGIRISDLQYRKAGLELGMLKGNAFVITLRNVKVASMDILDEAMNTIKNKGFINYYGMQRFGTASIPTHAIGLALLRSEWQKAADMILSKRHGEHPDVEAARDAWLVERDIDKALRLFPRRVVAERCILENFKKQKGDTRNVMGALSTIPRNLRLMYIHAYQSYVWNAIVSERIRIYGSDRPIAGDLVFDSAKDAMEVDGEEIIALEEDADDTGEATSKKNRKPYQPPRIRTLTEQDLDKYTIFDVIMPLPGTDVAYPGGKLGERYREFLRMDGLDPDNFQRKQKDYTLNGSYRAMLHLPREMSWAVLRYTDPDVPLAQSDEDKLLDFDPPVVVEDGKFMALQINLMLGTAAYATMALREITKTDTSSHFQTSLTAAAEDQKYRGAATADLAQAGLLDQAKVGEAMDPAT
ncbi:pseudouridine synthase [Pholiota conissans]|uniref:Pseudouridine synthase n=1 Tax=Pholiota conissans TaxID=109636 RepID=A0A9P5YVD9_9AGAR|nr:pseudouridine synthase [Pholiota conissans]